MFDGLFGNLGFGQKERPRDQALASSALRSAGVSSAFPDAARPLGDSIKTFQSNNGLKQDGVMTPGGPTELVLKAETARNDVRNLGGDVPSLVRLSDGVGPGQPNRPQDVETVGTLMQGAGALRRMQDANRSFGKLPGGKLPTAKQPSAKQPPAKQAAGRQPGPASPTSDPYAMAEKSGLGITGLTSGAAQPSPQPPAQPIPASQATGGEPQEGTLLDQAIRWFQEGFGLEPDGVIKPGGPTERRMDDVFSPPIVANIMDPSVVGGPAKPPPPGPFMTPNGIRYPENGHLDANGVFVPDPDPNAFKLRVDTPQGEQELTLQEFMAHYPDRPVRWPSLPSPLNMTLGPHRLRPFSGERVARYQAEQAARLQNSAGDDVLMGGSGTDTLLGSEGADRLDGATTTSSPLGRVESRGISPADLPLFEREYRRRELGEEGPSLDAATARRVEALYPQWRDEAAAITLFDKDRETFEAAAQTGAVSFRRDGWGVDIALGDGTTLTSVPMHKAKMVAETIAENPDAAAILKGFQEGTLSRAENREALGALFALEAERDAIRSAANPGRMSPQQRAELNAFEQKIKDLGYADLQAFDADIQQKAMIEEAFELSAKGVAPDVVTDTLVMGMRGEEGFQLVDAVELALSMAPVTGTGMALMASGQAAADMRTAAADGDWETFKGAATDLGIEAAAFIPFFGAAAKRGLKAAEAGARSSTLVSRGMDNVRARYDAAKDTWKQLHAQAELNVARTQGHASETQSLSAIRTAYPKNDAEKIFGRPISQGVWSKIAATHGRSIQATLTNRVSDAQEAHLADLLTDAGATVRGADPQNVQYTHPSHQNYERRFDVVIEEELASENGFLVPQATGRVNEDGDAILGTGLEGKYDAAPWTQKTFDTDVVPERAATAAVSNRGVQEVTQTALMRQHMHQIPIEKLRPALEQVLRKEQYGLDESEITTLLKGLDDFHAKERQARNGIPFGVFVRLHWQTFKKLLETPNAP